jgi:hypothetical protein
VRRPGRHRRISWCGHGVPPRAGLTGTRRRCQGYRPPSFMKRTAVAVALAGSKPSHSGLCGGGLIQAVPMATNFRATLRSKTG